MGHAEKVPVLNLNKPVEQVFYLSMHAIKKESSTIKVRAVFGVSAKSATGVFLNDLLLVGPTIHPSLVDILLHFCFHQIALTADISNVHGAIELILPDRYLIASKYTDLPVFLLNSEHKYWQKKFKNTENWKILYSVYGTCCKILKKRTKY